ncbi:MAG TPA: hypothetical protein VG962_01315 [Steroidobacteraceae bacterium]|nr:hypothetical protein [Steroidobacteraceae bacterium]
MQTDYQFTLSFLIIKKQDSKANPLVCLFLVQSRKRKAPASTPLSKEGKRSLRDLPEIIYLFFANQKKSTSNVFFFLDGTRKKQPKKNPEPMFMRLTPLWLSYFFFSNQKKK